MDSQGCKKLAEEFVTATKQYYSEARGPGHVHPPSQQELALAQNARYKLKELSPCLKHAPQDVQEAVEEIHANDHGDLAAWMQKAVEPVERWINEGCRPYSKHVAEPRGSSGEVENSRSFEERRGQWIKDIELLANLCGKRLEEIRPTQTGQERDDELPELYLYRDNADPKQLMKDFPGHRTRIELATMKIKTGPGNTFAVKDRPPIYTDNELRVSKDGCLWGNFLTLQWDSTLPADGKLQAEFDRVPVKLADGEIIKDFQQFLRERFEPMQDAPIEGKGKVFEKIVTIGFRPVMLSDLWDAWDFLKKGNLSALFSAKSMVERINNFWETLSVIRHQGTAFLPHEWTGRLAVVIHKENFVKIVWHLQGDPQLLEFLCKNCQGSGFDTLARDKRFTEFCECWKNELPQTKSRYTEEKTNEMKQTLRTFSDDLFLVFKNMFENEKLKGNLLEAALEYDKGERGAGAKNAQWDTSSSKGLDAYCDDLRARHGSKAVIVFLTPRYQNAICKETYRRGPAKTDEVLRFLDNHWWDPNYKRESAYYKAALAREQSLMESGGKPGERSDIENRFLDKADHNEENEACFYIGLTGIVEGILSKNYSALFGGLENLSEVLTPKKEGEESLLRAFPIGCVYYLGEPGKEGFEAFTFLRGRKKIIYKKNVLPEDAKVLSESKSLSELTGEAILSCYSAMSRDDKDRAGMWIERLKMESVRLELQAQQIATRKETAGKAETNQAPGPSAKGTTVETTDNAEVPRRRGRPKKLPAVPVNNNTFQLNEIPTDWQVVEGEALQRIWLALNTKDKTGHTFRKRFKSGKYMVGDIHHVEDNGEILRGCLAVRRAWYYRKIEKGAT